MLSPRTLPSFIARRGHLRKEEQLILNMHSRELASMLDSAIETRNWTIVSLCRDRLNHLAWKARLRTLPATDNLCLQKESLMDSQNATN